MQKLAIRKTAGLTALIMTLSLMLPIFAYAAALVVKGDYNPETDELEIVLRVDKDVYAAEGDSIPVVVYSGDTVIGTIYLTYAEGYAEDGYYYYVYKKKAAEDDLDLKGYDAVHINVYSNSNDSVPLATYQLSDGDEPGDKPGDGDEPGDKPGDGGSGGGSAPSTGGNSGTVNANPDGSVNADLLKETLKSGSATIRISGEVAKLPASALTAGGVVTIVSDLGSYELPLDELDLEALAEQLGVKLDELYIVVTIAELKGDDKAAAEAAIAAAGGKAVSPIVNFKLEAVAGDKSVEIKKFSKLVKRTVKLTGEGSNLVGVRIKNGSANPVLTKVGEGEAAIYSTTNSIYAAIDVAPKSFADLVNHWAEKDVNKLASKLIVNGTGADKFEPKRDVTRAEFAAMIVRALGLEATGPASFSDVAASAWYADAVAAAAEAGIVKGYANGTFRPNDKITRQELAAMVVRAQKLAGRDVSLSSSEIATLLGGYKDADKISAWARAELAAAIKSGIVNGTSSKTVSPTSAANRAEAAVMILRLLDNVDFI